MSNVDTARSAYDAFGRGDLGALQEQFAEDAVWVTSDELPLGGEVKGRDAIMGNFAQIPNYWDSFSVEPEEFIDAGNYVVVRGTQRASNEKGSFEPPSCTCSRSTRTVRPCAANSSPTAPRR